MTPYLILLGVLLAIACGVILQLWRIRLQDRRELERLARQAVEARTTEKAIATSVTAFAITDRTGHLDYVNRAFLELWGYEEASEVLGRSPLEFWASREDAGRVIEALQREGAWRGEMLARRRDGSSFVAELSADQVRDERGEISHMMASFIDVSERKRTEERLEESELVFRHLAENLPGAIFQYVEDETGQSTVRYCSPGCRDIWEVDAEEVERDASILWAVIDEEDLDPMRESVQRSRESLTRWFNIWRITTPSGKRKWLQGHGQPKLLEDGRVRWDAVIFDITSEREAQEARQLSEARLDSFFHESAAGLTILDRDCRYTHVNPTLARMNRRSVEEHIGKTPLELLGPAGAKGVEPLMRKVLQTGEAAVNVQASFADPEGPGQRHAIFSLFPVRDRMDQIIGLGGVVIETTAQKRAEEAQVELQFQLSRAQRMDSIGRLAAGVAHDFRSLLTVILGHAELIRDELPEDSPHRSGLDAITVAAERSAQITGHLLSFARKQPVAPELLALNAEVERMFETLRGLIGRQVDLGLELGERVGCVEINPGQLSQILTNLVVNARDALVGDGRIRVATSRRELAAGEREGTAPGTYFVLEVVDDGRGMDAATLARAFEPFFTTKDVGEGTGLGLSVIHGIVAQAKGFIDATSEIGRGARFAVHLPAAGLGQGAQTQASRGVATAGAGRKRLLVVEDEPQVLAMAVSILERQGFEVIAAPGADEALALVEELGSFDLLIMDMVLPGISGVRLAAMLREHRPELPVLFVSGYTDDAVSALGGQDLGSAPFLPKPYSAAQLIESVRVQLG